MTTAAFPLSAFAITMVSSYLRRLMARFSSIGRLLHFLAQFKAEVTF